MSVVEHGPLYQPCPRCKRAVELAEQCRNEEKWDAAQELCSQAAGCPGCRGLGYALTEEGLQFLTLLRPHLRVILACLTQEGGDG